MSISSTFYEQVLAKLPFAKKLQAQTVRTGKLQKTLSYEKAAHKMLLKSTAGPHFYASLELQS